MRQMEGGGAGDGVGSFARPLNPSDIAVPDGYRVDVFAVGLTTPINLVFTEAGDVLVADAGVVTGSGQVLKMTPNGFAVIAGGFNPPLTGINYLNGCIYVSHRGFVTVVAPDGSMNDIISGLPSWGDHHNNRVIFGPDDKMYFGQGTATNSGVVGEDNAYWVKNYPFFHDYPGEDIMLAGQNFTTPNFLVPAELTPAYTGAYKPFNVTSLPGERIQGIVRASGSVLRANTDGSGLERVAWGLRNPFRMRFYRDGRLFCANHGMDVRGSRPVDNSPDEFRTIEPGAWYGWPDFTGSLPLTLPQFRPPGGPQPAFLLARHPMKPPPPFAIFTPHSATMGFDFNYDPAFGYEGNAFMAEFGAEYPETTGGVPLPGVGHRVSMIDMTSGRISNFAINKTGYAASYAGGGGLELPIDVVFGPDGAMYVVDFGWNVPGETDEWIPGTGVIWRVTRG